VKSRTGCTRPRDIVGRLRARRAGEMVIVKDRDSTVVRAFDANTRFSTHLKYYDRQENAVKFFVDLIRTMDPHPDSYAFDVIRRKTFGFTSEEMRSTRLSGSAVQYMERALLYRDIAHAQGGVTDRPVSERVAALTEWTFVNVSNHFKQTTPTGGNFFDYNDVPLSLMIRGMGSCDRSAWVLATLAVHSGLPARMVYLFVDPEGPSSHTITEIKTERGWQAVDPYGNRIYPESVWSLSKSDPKYKHATLFLNPVEACAVLPMMRLAEMICRFYVPDQILFFDVWDSARTFVADHVAPGRPPHEIDGLTDRLLSEILQLSPFSTEDHVNPKVTIANIAVGRWDFPYWLRGYYTYNMFRKIKAEVLPFLSILRPARLLQLRGQYEEAAAALAALDNAPRDAIGMLHEQRDYFSILNHYYLNAYARVESDVARFEKTWPASPRLPMLKYILAHSLTRLNRSAEASQIYPSGSNFEGRGLLR